MSTMTITPHESEARRRFAALTQQPESRWTIVSKIEIGMWYDFYCPITGKYGQCCMGENGAWKQDPRGERPVILWWHDPRKKRRKMEKVSAQ